MSLTQLKQELLTPEEYSYWLAYGELEFKYEKLQAILPLLESFNEGDESIWKF